MHLKVFIVFGIGRKISESLKEMLTKGAIKYYKSTKIEKNKEYK